MHRLGTNHVAISSKLKLESVNPRSVFEAELIHLGNIPCGRTYNDRKTGMRPELELA
jgi:hypothetical protein